MRTVTLNVDVPADREIRIKLPEDVPEGPTEIVVVIAAGRPLKHGTLGDLLDSDFYGSWADRTDLPDTPEYVRQLREQEWRRGGDVS